jgi:hypothetical protein
MTGDPNVREFRDPCFACGHTDRVTSDPAACGGCGLPTTMPPVAEWPRPVKAYLVKAMLARAFAPYNGNEDRGWLSLLDTTFVRARVKVPGKGAWIVKQGTPPGLLWPLVLKLAGLAPHLTTSDSTPDHVPE